MSNISGEPIFDDRFVRQLNPDSAVGKSVERSAQALHSESNKPLPLSSHLASVHGVISEDDAQHYAKHQRRP